MCFIITTHITDSITSQYWWECCRCIRKFYNEPIYIINDNSDDQYSIDVCNFTNCFLINSEFPNRGEILPYYYLYTMKLAEKACILHDTTFIQNKIDISSICTVRFLWHFTHKNERRTQIYNAILKGLENKNNIIKRFLKNQWNGCFGVQSVITLTFLEKLVLKYNFFKLLPLIMNRSDRKTFERIFAIMCFEEDKTLIDNQSICGHIFYTNIRWKLSFSEYGRLKDNIRKHYKMIKCFTGR